MSENRTLSKYSKFEALDEYLDWAAKYRSHLLILEIDINIKLNNKNKIFIALDFCDLLEHCIPSLYNLTFMIIKNSSEGEKFVKNELGRCAIFYFLQSLYQKPIILLPPYLHESISFLESSKYQMNKAMEADRREISERYVRKVENKLKACFNKNQCEDSQELLNRLISVGPDMALILSPYFMSGLRGYEEFLKKNITPFPQDYFPREFSNYCELISDVNKENSKDIELVLSLIRPTKPISNRRDAFAIRCIEELNHGIGENNILLLASSASHMVKFKDRINCNEPFIYLNCSINRIDCQKIIDGKTISLLRI
jgi:hypothetical protein